MTCQTVSYSLATNSAAGMFAGAAAGAVVSCMTHYIRSPLIKESPLAAVVPPLGFYAGLLAALPCLKLFPRLCPQLRSMISVSIGITAIASSLFSLGGVDMTPVNSTSLGVGLGAITGIFTALFFSSNLLNSAREEDPEPPFSWQEIRNFFPSGKELLILNIANLANGILAGIASGFLVAFLSQKIPETSLIAATIPPAGYTAAMLTSIPFIALSRCVSDSSREVAVINAIFTSALAGLLASGGIDMSCMRSAATGAGMGAALAPVIAAGFSCIQGLSAEDPANYDVENTPFISPEASYCEWIPVACVLAVAGALSGATSGALSSTIGELTKDSFAIVTVAPTALTAGTIVGYTPIFLLARTKCLDQRVIAAASILAALTATTSSVMAMGGADMPLIRSTAAGGGSGVVIAASAISSFFVARRLSR